jgi:hypothetical protein
VIEVHTPGGNMVPVNPDHIVYVQTITSEGRKRNELNLSTGDVIYVKETPVQIMELINADRI